MTLDWVVRGMRVSPLRGALARPASVEMTEFLVIRAKYGGPSPTAQDDGRMLVDLSGHDEEVEAAGCVGLVEDGFGGDAEVFWRGFVDVHEGLWIAIDEREP